MLVYDLQALQSVDHGGRGIGRYVAELAATLAREHPDAIDVFAWHDELPEPASLTALGIGGRAAPYSALRGTTVDVLHTGSPFELRDLGDVAVPVRARRHVVTCYDLIPYRFPDVYLRDPERAARYRSRLGMLAAADAVVTDSRSAADDVVATLGVAPRRVTVIGGGASDRFRPPDPDDTVEARLLRLRAALPGLRPGFVFGPTGIDWRKNYEGLLRAYGRLDEPLRRAHQLVLGCAANDEQRAGLGQLAAELGIELLVTGHVGDEVLVDLYRSAELVAVTSFYEGFGLPVLEARRCGARVVVSDSSSLPELVPDPEARFDPHDVDAIAAVIGRALTDVAFAARLDRAPGAEASWSTAAARLVEVYDRQRAAARRRWPQPTRRPTLAVVAPLPPTPSGIADFTQRLVTAGADARADGAGMPDIEVFTSPTAASDLTTVASVPVPVQPLATLPARWAAGDLDHVLYCIGNHPFHRDAVATMGLVPGDLFLHDVRLSGLFGDPDTGTDADRRVAEVVHRARRVLVQSRHAVELVGAATGATAIDVGPHHCELVAPGTSPPEDDPWVVTAGIAVAAKSTADVVAALRLLHERRRVRTAVVGSWGEAFVGPGDPVVATGRVDDDDFDAWLRRATVLVQLRATTSGESSGVVAKALARGVPVVVSDLGAMAELPDEAVVKVPVGIEPDALAAVVESLLDDPARRRAMRSAAIAYAEANRPTDQWQRVVAAMIDER